MTTKTQNSAKKQNFIRTVGRRKTSVARVRLYEEQGDNTINDQSVSTYFPGQYKQSLFLNPFKLTNTVGKYHITVKVEGGGINSQLGAVIHGIARALVKKNPEFKTILKKNNLITRDPRMKERRKPGFAQAARARKQSPKR